MKKIGILGCGYVGQFLARHFKSKGMYVSATTRKKDRVDSLKKLVDQVYFLQEETLASFISAQEVVLICTAPDKNEEYESAYLAVANQIGKALNQSPQPSTVIYTSSTSVYGEHDGNWVTETTPLIPYSEKSKVLIEAEKIVMDFDRYGIKPCIFRLGEIYGPGRSIVDRLRMATTPFRGDGRAYTNLIHVEDIVGAVDASIERDWVGIYNLCNDVHMPRREFYEMLCKEEKIPSVTWDPSQASLHGGNKRVSNDKIKAAGYIFSYSLYSKKSPQRQ